MDDQNEQTKHVIYDKNSAKPIAYVQLQCIEKGQHKYKIECAGGVRCEKKWESIGKVASLRIHLKENHGFELERGWKPTKHCGKPFCCNPASNSTSNTHNQQNPNVSNESQNILVDPSNNLIPPGDIDMDRYIEDLARSEADLAQNEDLRSEANEDTNNNMDTDDSNNLNLANDIPILAISHPLNNTSAPPSTLPTSSGLSLVKEPPKCGHSRTCITKRTKKDGPNTGRLFYVCPEYISNQCGCFHWKDEWDNNENSDERGSVSIIPKHTPAPTNTAKPIVLIYNNYIHKEPYINYYSNSSACYRCGSYSHWADDCYARKGYRNQRWNRQWW